MQALTSFWWSILFPTPTRFIIACIAFEVSKSSANAEQTTLLVLCKVWNIMYIIIIHLCDLKSHLKNSHTRQKLTVSKIFSSISPPLNLPATKLSQSFMKLSSFLVIPTAFCMTSSENSMPTMKFNLLHMDQNHLESIYFKHYRFDNEKVGKAF